MLRIIFERSKEPAPGRRKQLERRTWSWGGAVLGGLEDGLDCVSPGQLE